MSTSKKFDEFLNRKAGVGNDPFEQSLPNVNAGMNRNGSNSVSVEINKREVAPSLAIFHKTGTLQGV